MNKTKDSSKQKKIDTRMSLYIKVLHQEGGVSCKEIKKRFPQYALRSIYRHSKKPLHIDQRKFNKGRPKKLTERYERKILRAVHNLRKEVSSFTAKRIQEEAQAGHVTTRTVRRCLRKHGFHYRQSRKKGLVSKQDKKIRLTFARKALHFEKDFWKNGIDFYLDGVGFAHKTNPHGEARAAGTMQWRKPNEGLSRTTKGKKEGSGGKMAHFYVAISYNKGVVMCKQYTWRVTGVRFAEFLTKQFPRTFRRSGARSARGRTFLQDGDPRQVSAVATKAWERLGCQCFRIPARSPDLNPIENIFHLVRKQLSDDALRLEIKKESYQMFCKRVARTIKEFPMDVIDKTIESMERRIGLVIKGRGDRTKY